jgi:hypothetical protein
MVDLDDVIEAIEDYTYLSAQSSAEAGATPPTNTSANILYATSSRRQGNATRFYAMATLQIAKDSAKAGVTLDDEYTLQAYAYLIQYLYERKFKDFNATSVSSSGDSVTRPGSGALQNYKALFEDNKVIDTTIVRHTDYQNYPADWRNTQLPIDDIKIQN